MAAVFTISALGPAHALSVAWADEDPPSAEPVMSVSVAALGWDFTPVIQNEVIKGIFAQIRPEIVVEGNLETLWFEQDENGDWSVSSWSGSGTAPNALGWIRSHFNDDEIFDMNPKLLTQAPGPILDHETHTVIEGIWVAPTVLDGGLLADDPLQLLLGDGPRTPEMFEMMANNGWPVAPELSPLCSAHHGDDCGGGSEEMTLQQLLDALAATTQSFMPGRATTIVGDMDPSAVNILDEACWCKERTGVPTCQIQVRLEVGTGGYWRHNEKVCRTHHRTSGETFLLCWSCVDEWDEDIVTPDLNPVWFPVGDQAE